MIKTGNYRICRNVRGKGKLMEVLFTGNEIELKKFISLMKWDLKYTYFFQEEVIITDYLEYKKESYFRILKII